MPSRAELTSVARPGSLACSVKPQSVGELSNEHENDGLPEEDVLVLLPFWMLTSISATVEPPD